MSPEYISAAGVSFAFLALLLVAEVWYRKGSVKPEWTRKFVHTGGGVICLSFPFLPLTGGLVFLMAITLSALMYAGRRYQFLRGLHSVSRKTGGTEYYPLSICLLYVVSHEEAWLYIASLLVLMIADAFAALIGLTYGKVKFEVEDSTKSLEGSIVFMLIAFLALHLPVLLMTDLPRSVCVLSALMVAVLVTGFEAISLRGTDNLFVPLGTYFVLSRVTEHPASYIAYQISVLALICVVISVLSWRVKRFNTGASLSFMLFMFGCWALGGDTWAFIGLLAIAGYMGVWVLCPLRAAGEHSDVKVLVVSQAAFVALAILFIADYCQALTWFFNPFLVAITVTFSMSIFNHYLLFTDGPRSFLKRCLMSVLLALVAVATVMLLPWLIARSPSGVLFPLTVIIAGTSLLHNVVIGRAPGESGVTLWGARRILLTVIAVAASIGLQKWHLLPIWNG